MRPLSLASYDVLLRTGNPLVKGEMPKDGTPEFTSAIMGFVFTHCAPWPEVVRASFNDQAFREAALIFCGGLTPADFQTAFKRLEEQSRELEAAQVETMAGHRRKKAPPCDEPGFLAAQVFAIAAETGWPEERILFMPLARLAQYQHCLLRRNGVRTHWSSHRGEPNQPAGAVGGAAEEIESQQKP